jgi:LacI family transcriptional regulator
MSRTDSWKPSTAFFVRIHNFTTMSSSPNTLTPGLPEPAAGDGRVLPPAQNRARLADVATLAGVSKSIASRILNGTPGLSIRPETRARVVEVAQQLNYRPHTGARGLRRAHNGAISLVIPDLLNPIFALISRGSVHRAREYDFAVLLTEDTDPEEANRIVVDLVRGGRIDGAIVASASPRHPLLASLRELDVPHVFVLRTIRGSGRNVIPPDERMSALAVDHLCDLGHTVIGHLAGPRGLSTTSRLSAGFRKQAARRGAQQAFVSGHDFSERGGAEAAHSLLGQTPRPTGLTTESVGQAAGALHAAAQLGLRVPEDLSIISCADAPLVEYLNPALTTISVSFATYGATAMDALSRQLLGEAPHDVHVDVEPHLVVRESTAPAPTEVTAMPTMS